MLKPTQHVPVGAGFALLHALLLPAPPLISVPPGAAPIVVNPGEVLFPGNGPGSVVLLVLGHAGEGLVVLPGSVPPRPERAPRSLRCGRALRGGPGAGLRVRELLGDGAHLLLRDVRVVLDGERDGQVRLVELVPEASQAADPADARPGHPPPGGVQMERGGPPTGGEKK